MSPPASEPWPHPVGEVPEGQSCDMSGKSRSRSLPLSSGLPSALASLLPVLQSQPQHRYPAQLAPFSRYPHRTGVSACGEGFGTLLAAAYEVASSCGMVMTKYALLRTLRSPTTQAVDAPLDARRKMAH